MKIIVYENYERMYSTHIIKLKLILLWFIETKKCMITLCGTGGTMKLFTCSKWSTHACLHPYICVMKIANLWKASCFGAQSWEFEENRIGKRNVGIQYICLEKLWFYAFNLHSQSVICIHNKYILSYEIYTIFKNVHI